MKKIRVLALVVMAMLLVVASAQAAGSLSVSGSYSGGKISWSVSGWHDTYDVFIDGSKLVQRSANSGSYNHTLSAGSHTLKVVDLDGCTGSDTITVSGGDPEPVVTVAPTEAPVDEPTDEPETTKKPSTSKKPSTTKTTSTAGDDVPKTGDATASTLVIVLMMVAAAAILVIRKAARNR